MQQFIKVLFARWAPLLATCGVTNALPAQDHIWLQNYTSEILHSCRKTATDGTVVYGPNGCSGKHTCYAGTWMRDSFYGFSSGWRQIPNAEEALESAAYLLRRAQPSMPHFLPQSVDLSGHAAYGQHGAPTTLDAGAFAGLMLSFFVSGAGREVSGGGAAFLKEFGSAVALAMEATPMRHGLPWSDPARPCVGYGFTDTIMKTGNELYSSILFWDASRQLAKAFGDAGNASMAKRFQLHASHVEANFSSSFWSDKHGMFMATNGLESDRIDVWGSAYAALAGLALPEQASRIASFLAANRAKIFYAGQTRMLPEGAVWSREFPGEQKWFGPGRYQDGGYWGTPSHHTIVLLAKHGYMQLACELLSDAVSNFRSHGGWEWIGRGAVSGTGAPTYVATVANTLKAAEELECWKSELAHG